MLAATPAQQRQQFQAETTPHLLAADFLDDNGYIWYGPEDADPMPVIRKWRGDYYAWKDGYYRPFSRETLEIQLTAWLQSQHYRWKVTYGRTLRITPSLLRTLVLNLDPHIVIRDGYEPNQWLDRYESPTPPQRPRVLAVRNGLLPLDQGEEPELLDHTPNYFNASCLPFDYDPKAVCPRWEAFLADVMDGDSERIELLQQWVGYLLSADLRQHRFLLCVGEGANGKSVFFEIIRAVLGPANCSSVPLSRFGNPFCLHATLGKMVNMSSESASMIGEEAESLLKAFVAGDLLTFERKYRDPLQARPTAKVMIATNSLPRFADRSQGLWRRVLLVPFDKTVPEVEQNKTLAQEIGASERPGILNWAMAGLADLTRHGGFCLPRVSVAALETYRRDANPAHAFLLDNYVASADYEGLPVREVYQSYQQWCHDNGYRPLAASHLGQQVRRTFPLCRVAHRRAGSRRVRVYSGLIVQEGSPVATDSPYRNGFFDGPRQQTPAVGPKIDHADYVLNA